MYVRLAFAVAAHLDPDILVIDEVLAVGDAAFQSRCLGKLKGVAGGGRTVVFVSHNMGAVQKLTESIVWLDAGRLCYQGGVREGISSYLESLENNRISLDLAPFNGPLDGTIRFLSLLVLQDGTEVQTVTPDRPITLRIHGESQQVLVDMDITVSFYGDGVRLFSCHDAPQGTVLKAGCFTSEYIIDAYALRPGRYSISVGGRRYGRADWIWGENVASIAVVERWDDVCQERDEGLLTMKYSSNRVQ